MERHCGDRVVVASSLASHRTSFEFFVFITASEWDIDRLSVLFVDIGFCCFHDQWSIFAYSSLRAPAM